MDLWVLTAELSLSKKAQLILVEYLTL